MTAQPDVLFAFDPACPWTWLTSRWLVDVAASRSLSIGWRPLSLKVLNGGDIPEQYREAADASFRALRIVQALQGDDAAIGRFYDQLGERIHPGGQPLTLALVREAADAAGVPADAMDDGALDEAITEATHAAIEAAGGDVGSPVLTWPSTGRSTSGPVVSPAPTGDAAAALWDAVVAAMAVPGFLELKHGRTDVQPTFA